jgi:Uncharacterized enzyme involved in inositol metabolism
MKQHYKPSELTLRLDPPALGLRYTSAQRLELSGDGLTVEAEAEEVCLVCIKGKGSFRHEGQGGEVVLRDILYLPPGDSVTLEGKDCVLMRFGAPCSAKTRFAHIPFAEVDADARHKVYGDEKHGTRRDVWNAIDEQFPSSRFLVGFCTGRDGGWTAWPPHEHAAEREETYVYFDMGDAFGVQFVYDDMDDPYCVAMIREGHLVAIPRGFHPNCGCPKGGISYVYCMVATHEGEREFMDLRCQEIFGDRLA